MYVMSLQRSLPFRLIISPILGEETLNGLGSFTVTLVTLVVPANLLTRLDRYHCQLAAPSRDFFVA